MCTSNSGLDASCRDLTAKADQYLKAKIGLHPGLHVDCQVCMIWGLQGLHGFGAAMSAARPTKGKLSHLYTAILAASSCSCGCETLAASGC